MNTKQKLKSAVIAGLMVLGLGVMQKAEALGTPTDTMNILIRPDVSYAVDISSPFVAGYNFGLVAPGVTTISTVAIDVENAGTIVEFFSLGVVDTTGGGNAWTNNEGNLNPGTTSYVMQGVFLADGSTQPPSASFNGAANNVPIAPPSTADSRFGQGTGFAGKTAAGVTKDLWLRFHMPTAVYESGWHTLLLSITGQSQ